MLDWQLALTLATVSCSAAYLIGLGWRTWKNRGCSGSCGCSKKKPSTPTGGTFIPADQLVVRRRQGV
jgi:hypothetical protein